MENQNSERQPYTEAGELYESLSALQQKIEGNTATPEEVELYQQQYQRLQELVQAQRQQEEQPQPQRNYRTEVQSAETVIQEPYSPDQPIHLLMLELARVKAQQANELNWQLTEWAKARLLNAVAIGVALCVLWFGSAAATRGMLSMTTKVPVQEIQK